MAEMTAKEKEEYARITENAEQIEMKLDEPKRTPIVYGYVRVSTKGQARDGNSLEAQETALRNAGATEIVVDTYTGVTKERPELERLLPRLEEGDTFMATKLDRIARSVLHGIELISSLQDRGIKVHVLKTGLLDNTPTGHMIRNVLLSFAEFERSLIMERTREGKEIARKKPGYREGRPKKYGKKQMDHAMQLLEDHSYTQVAELTGISKSTLAREKARRRLG